MDYTRSVNSLLNRLQERGVRIVAVHDGEEGIIFPFKISKLAARKLAVEMITSVDNSVVYVTLDGQGGAFGASLYIVLGNDESEILSDWSINPGRGTLSLPSCAQQTSLSNIIDEVSIQHYGAFES